MSKPVLSSSDKATFRAMLAGAASNPDVGVVSNRYPWQSKMAFEKLLDVAKTKKEGIRILSGSCHEGYYKEDLVKKFTECKDAGCPFIRILVWQKSADGICPALLKLAEDDTIDLRISGTDDFASTVPHFLLVGENAFSSRSWTSAFLTSQTTFTETEPQVPARIDFNDPVTGKTLTGIFVKFWGTA